MWRKACVVLCLAAAPGSADAQAPQTLPTARSACDAAAARIPPRPLAAQGGAAFAQRVAALDAPSRDALARDELLAGNLPDFLRSLVPLRLVARTADGAIRHIVLCVLPDYLAVGSDDDFLLMPLGLAAALDVAARLGFMLPTTRIVDAIHAQAAVQLPPLPMPPGPAMVSVAAFVQHGAAILRQRLLQHASMTSLTAGHKKDLVWTRRLQAAPDRVAIYGWHRMNGVPIQPLSLVHGAGYADYSHGVRLVSTMVTVDGQPASIFDVLADERLAPMLSSEGAWRSAGRGH